MGTKRGFALLPVEQVKEIAFMGGKAVQAMGKGFKWTPEQASQAGKKAVQAIRAKYGPDYWKRMAEARSQKLKESKNG